MEVSIEKLLEIQQLRKSINDSDLNDLVFTYKGEVIKPDPKLVEEFGFFGLNNTDFVYHYFDEDLKAFVPF